MIWRFSNDSYRNISATETEALLAVKRIKKGPSPKRTKKKEDELGFLILLVVGFAVLGALATIYSPKKDIAHLRLYIGSQERMFSGEVVPEMTVLDAFNASMLTGNIPFKFSIESGRTRIIELGGLSSANIGDKIAVFRNGQKISIFTLNREPVYTDDEITVKMFLSSSR